MRQPKREPKREPKPNRMNTPIRLKPGHWTTYLNINQRCAQEGPMRKGTYIALTTRQAIFDTFASLGGLDAMLAWAKDNPDAFYGALLPRLLPKPEEQTSAPSWSITVQKLSSPDGVTETRALVVQGKTEETEDEDDTSEATSKDEATEEPAPTSTWDQVERRVSKRRVQIVHRSWNRRISTKRDRRGWDKYDAE